MAISWTRPEYLETYLCSTLAAGRYSHILAGVWSVEICCISWSKHGGF